MSTATHTTSSTTTRTQTAARSQVLGDLKEDHKRVRKAYKAFEKLDREQNPQECEALVQQVLDELTLHAALEEEFLYPVVHDLIDEPDLIDEAEVEHETMHTAISQLRDMGASDEKFAARFTVLCEYVLHHVKEEEGEIFPKLEQLKLDWDAMAEGMATRRAEADVDGDGMDGQTSGRNDNGVNGRRARPAARAAT